MCTKFPHESDSERILYINLHYFAKVVIKSQV